MRFGLIEQNFQEPHNKMKPEKGHLSKEPNWWWPKCCCQQYISCKYLIDIPWALGGMCVRACQQRFEWDVTGVKVGQSGSIYSSHAFCSPAGKNFKWSSWLAPYAPNIRSTIIVHYGPYKQTRISILALYSVGFGFWCFTKSFWGIFARIMQMCGHLTPWLGTMQNSILFLLASALSCSMKVSV